MLVKLRAAVSRYEMSRGRGSSRTHHWLNLWGGDRIPGRERDAASAANHKFCLSMYQAASALAYAMKSVSAF
eukprot:622218-Amphidinium_carterae.1